MWVYVDLKSGEKVVQILDQATGVWSRAGLEVPHKNCNAENRCTHCLKFPGMHLVAPPVSAPWIEVQPEVIDLNCSGSESDS